MQCANKDEGFFAGDNKSKNTESLAQRSTQFLTNMGWQAWQPAKNINRILTLLILDFVYVNSNTNSLRYHMQEHCSVMYCTEYSSLSPTSLHCSYKHTLTTITIISFIAIINFTKFTSFMTKHTQYPRP